MRILLLVVVSLLSIGCSDGNNDSSDSGSARPESDTSASGSSPTAPDDSKLAASVEFQLNAGQINDYDNFGQYLQYTEGVAYQFRCTTKYVDLTERYTVYVKDNSEFLIKGAAISLIADNNIVSQT